MSGHPQYKPLIDKLSQALKDMVSELNHHPLTNLATPDWTNKDILCHIVFWHNYYAQNYASQAAHTSPFIFPSRGGSTRNKDGVNLLKSKPKKELLSLLNTAHHSLSQSILIHQIPSMIYTGSHRYATSDFLYMITRHITKHADQIRHSHPQHT